MLLKNEILERVRKCIYYSIIVDCTPDISHQEQMTLIIRYVAISEKTKDSSSKVEVQESFIGFINIDQTTGLAMTEVILEALNNAGRSHFE